MPAAWTLVTLVVAQHVVAQGVDALSVQDLQALYSSPVESVSAWTKRALAFVPTDAVTKWCASWSTATAQEDAVELEDFFPPPMPLELEGEDAVRSYPAFPHSPLLVAASNCDRVVLRWKSFDDDRWPVDAFLLQRFPDLQAQPQWVVLSSSNASELIDSRVLPGFHYTYRVQAVSGDIASAYAYHWTRIDPLSEAARLDAAARAGWLGPMHSMAHRHSDALRTIGLIFACFLTVYGLMRANVMSVQGTRSRSYRLKRIKKSTSEGVAAAAAEAASTTSKASLDRRSSSSSTSSPGSALVDSARSNALVDLTAAPGAAADPGAGRRASLTTTTRESTAEDPTTVEEPPFRRHAQSLSGATARAAGEKAEYCQDCRKRFGIFRRRHLCDICHSVTLCRKCGFQAPVESFSGGQRASSGSAAASKQTKLKIRTICRTCCDDVYRYSTAPSVRPTLVPQQHSI